VNPDAVAPGTYSTLVYFQGYLYQRPSKQKLYVFQWQNKLFSWSPVATVPTVFDFPGSQPTITTDAGANAILWEVLAIASGPMNGKQESCCDREWWFMSNPS
jgi:hypothetical protein